MENPKLLLLPALILIFSVAFISAVPSWNTNFNQDLTWYYSFEETSGTTVYDLTFNYNGTNVGATINQDGFFGRCYSFTDDYVTVPFNSANLDNFTFATAIYIDNAEGEGFILSHDDLGNTDQSYQLVVQNKKIAILYSGVSWYYTINDYVTQNQTWYHLAWIREDTNWMIYVNGINVENITTSNPIERTGDWNIGYGYTGFTGKVDELGLWERILSPEEINDLYSSYAPTPPTSGGILHYDNLITPEEPVSTPPITGEVTNEPKTSFGLFSTIKNFFVRIDAWFSNLFN